MREWPPALTSTAVARIAILAASLALLSGCAGYRLGPTNGLAAGDKSVRIKPFSNETIEPRLTDAVTLQLRKQIQRDGTYKLATQGEADIVVSGVLTRYLRFPLGFAPQDVLTVQDFRVMLTAQVTAIERTSGKVLLNRSVNGVTLVRVSNDLTSAERQAMPLLAADLARNITDLLADGTW